jgi:hypothetical protein
VQSYQQVQKPAAIPLRGLHDKIVSHVNQQQLLLDVYLGSLLY